MCVVYVRVGVWTCVRAFVFACLCVYMLVLCDSVITCLPVCVSACVF